MMLLKAKAEKNRRISDVYIFTAIGHMSAGKKIGALYGDSYEREGKW